MKSSSRAVYICTLCFLSVAMIHGCTTTAPPESGGSGTADFSESLYQEAFEAWTREGRIYEGLDVKLISAATYMSPQFRSAFAEEYARLYRLTPLEKDKFIADQNNAGAAYEDFIFAAYVPEKAWDDFSKKNSIWKIYLTSDTTEQVTPIEIRKLDKRDAKTAYFYSFLTPWKSIYRIRFSKWPAGDATQTTAGAPASFKLVVTSVLGSAEMAWNLNQ